MSHPLVETETTNRVSLEEDSPALREIILLGLRAKGVAVPDHASIRLERVSGWENAKTAIKVVW